MFCELFPNGQGKDANPAIQLFGKRFFNDQTPIELLIEFLLVNTSSKRLSGQTTAVASPLLPMNMIGNWAATSDLEYAPKARLNMKLFAFMGASRLDSRHETHREHYKDILQRLQSRIKVADSGTENDVLRTLENLFLGFQGAGAGRTWCAQSFMPICAGLLARETIWNESVARRNAPHTWSEVMGDLGEYFSSSKRLFLARGGETLYLQVCNALRQHPDVIRRWVDESKVQLEPSEQNPSALHEELQRELAQLMTYCPQTVSDIAEFLDSGVEPDTSRSTDTHDGEPHYVTAGSCPAESWPEGYLLAVDILRLCQADLDVVERLQLMEVACAMQVLRSLASQSARHYPSKGTAFWPGYRLAISAPDEHDPAIKRLSRQTVKKVEKLIYRAIRSEGVQLPEDEVQKDKLLKEADRRYGGKLFVSMAKRIGLLVPRRGPGARFTLNEQLLRFLVVTTVPMGGRLTYDRFKELVEARHGLVFDTPGFTRASAWVDDGGKATMGSKIDWWLQEMLGAAGLLVHLSDSCSLVENPATKKGAGK